jgi:hypothetical protein
MEQQNNTNCEFVKQVLNDYSKSIIVESHWLYVWAKMRNHIDKCGY